MATTTTISEREYRELALNDPDRNWELWDGALVEKPSMSIKHNDVAFYLGLALANQLDRSVYRVNVNGDRARLSPRSYYIPDVVVIPVAYQQAIDPRSLGVYADPLPLVVEVWSPTTGDYDIAAKIPAYQARGDLEIWLLHPYERTLTAWRRQPDGSYTQDLYQGGEVPVVSLPGVTIDLDALLDEGGKTARTTDSQ
jgi:Uma2 family endonuclease